MVNKCCAFGCMSGYVGQNPTTGSGMCITFHSFPQYNSWKSIRANPYDDFMLSKHLRMHSLHFRDWDFIEQPQYINAHHRKKQSDYQQLKSRYLKKDTVPTVFLNARSWGQHRPTHASRNKGEVDSRVSTAWRIPLLAAWSSVECVAGVGTRRASSHHSSRRSNCGDNVRWQGGRIFSLPQSAESTHRKFSIAFLCCGTLTTSIIDSDCQFLDPMHCAWPQNCI